MGVAHGPASWGLLRSLVHFSWFPDFPIGLFVVAVPRHAQLRAFQTARGWYLSTVPKLFITAGPQRPSTFISYEMVMANLPRGWN
jgi:hypothetical protein